MTIRVTIRKPGLNTWNDAPTAIVKADTWQKTAVNLYNRHYRPAGGRLRQMATIQQVGSGAHSRQYECQFGVSAGAQNMSLDSAVQVLLEEVR